MSRLLSCGRHASRGVVGVVLGRGRTESSSLLLRQQLVMTAGMTQTADMSTFEQMFNKVVTAPPVYFIEDSLAHFHDVSGRLIIAFSV